VGIILSSAICFLLIGVIVWLRPATKEPHGHPSPHWDEEEKGKKQTETGGSG